MERGGAAEENESSARRLFLIYLDQHLGEVFQSIKKYNLL